MNFKQEIINKNIQFNEREFDRYLKFMENCYIPKDFNGLLEKHHILPRKLFPEYSKLTTNIKRLTTRQHYICHWMLAKSLGQNMWFAFNMMRRVGKNSILYSYAREYISNIISKTNKGKKRSEKVKENISRRLTNMVCVKFKNDTTEKTYYVSKNDPRYISGEMIYYRTGKRHTDDTKIKISENGIKGKKAFVDNTGNVIYLDINKGLELNYSLGRTEEYKQKTRNNKQNCMWVHIIDTRKDRLIKKELFDPTLHLKGRKNGKGWSIINSSDMHKGDNNIMRKSKIARDFIAEKLSKKYKLISPEGKEYIITSRLNDFCVIHGLCKAIIIKYLNTNEEIKKGRAKGWKSFGI